MNVTTYLAATAGRMQDLFLSLVKLLIGRISG